MTFLLSWGRVLLWGALCALSGPLWVVGAALAWSHRLVNGLWVAVIRWAFWEPTQAVWSRFVRAVRLARAETSPEIQNELERQRKAREFQKRARRARR